MKKFKILTTIILPLVILVIGTVCYNLNKPTSINYFIASKVYKSPANIAFIDNNFYKCIVDNYNKINQTTIAYTENLNDEQLQTITVLNCYGYGKSDEEKIANVNGLEKLVNLNKLILTDNLLTEINLANNSNLTNLYLSGNQLTELDLSSNINLSYLDIGYMSYESFGGASSRNNGNNINKLTLPNTENLKWLYLDNNQLTEIDVSNHVNLIELTVNNNQLTQLNLSNNAKLQELSVDDNQLTELDLSNNTNLTELVSQRNQLNSVNIVGAEKLTFIQLNNNNIQNIDLSDNVNLKRLELAENDLSELDLTNNILLERLSASKNELTSVNITGLNQLQYLYLKDNSISNINLSDNINLKWIELYQNKLTELDVTKNINLTHLSLGHGSYGVTYEEGDMSNNLKELDLSKNVNLEYLNVARNNLSKLDVSHNTNLKELVAGHNKLNQLIIDENQNLTTVDCIDNELIEIDVNKLSSLQKLYLSDNEFSEIDVSQNSNLNSLVIENNNLQQIDVSSNENLVRLDVKHNQLTNINLKNNLLLDSLSVQYNNLTHLDVSNNNNLYVLQASNNPFKYNVGVYVNEELDLSNDLGFVNLPNDKSSKFYQKHASVEGLNFNDNIVSSDRIGEYNALIYYKHNLYQNGPVYSGTYNIYVIEATSDKYEINNEEEYIYTGSDVDTETILSNIDLNYGEAVIEDNKLLIKYNDKLVKSFNVINISSEKYDISSENGYIYSKIDKDSQIILNNIKLNYASALIENNQLIITYNDKIFDSLDIVTVQSEKYDLLKEFVYTGTYDFHLNDISIINGSAELDGDILIIKYGNQILTEYPIYNINFGELKVIRNKKIPVVEETTYEDFVSNISTNGLNYKIYNDELEVSEGNITPGMTLKVYYNEEVIDEYTITDEYLEFSENLNIDEEDDVIENLNVGQTVENIKENIDTTGDVKVVNQEGVEVTDSIVGTGYKVVIELSKETIEYTLIVNGDITGDGKIRMSDVMKGANYVLDNSTIQDQIYIKAGDVTGDSKIKMSDVMKLANAVLEGGVLK